MKKLLIPALVATAIVATAKAPKESVLMTVDGQPVTLSEFEYLYHKNANQQLEQQTLDEYLQMFVDYKLKVADARHCGVDTTAAFRKEFRGYRAELAAPYLRDSLMEKQLLEESYKHTLENVEINHLMVGLDQRERIDSIRNAIVNGGADFLTMAERFTTDPSWERNHGYYGWVQANRYPYEFEEGVYNTPVGQISDVITTRFGYHLVQVLSRRADAGEVHAAHILVSYPGGERTPESEAAAKVRIDSIYTALQNGADFAALAKQLSDCPSGKQGGDLGWFGRGQMVAEFDQKSFEMADGTISEPVATRFGWHIIKRFGSRQASREDLEPQLKRAIERDSRSERPILAKIDELKKEYKNSVNSTAVAKLKSAAATEAGLESLAADKTTLLTVADSVVTIADFVNPAPRFAPTPSVDEQIDEAVNVRLNKTLLAYEDHRLAEKYPEFRNLSNEYREGLMLFEVSNQNVWNRPTQDPEGLEAYFQANREKYATWEAPRWKGWVVYASTDSLMQEVNKYLDEQKPAFADAGTSLKEAFPRNIKIERVVLPKGENAIVDATAFGGEKPDLSTDRRWVAYTTYGGHVIDQPEEAADVRATVSADWQQVLEKEWVERLRATYPVKIDQKVLKKVK
jgi:peptidyl-prolyl cis-trans isomerase SurA